MAGNGFGESLKRIREAAGLTQAGLARLLQVRQQTLAKWEAAEADPQWSTVMRLCRVLEVTPNDFLPPARRGRRQRLTASN